MSFLNPDEKASSSELVSRLQEADRARVGYLPNYSVLFSLHPEAYEGWRHLIKEIASPMDPRRYELATLAAAHRLRSTYCSIAHGKVLADQFLEPGEIKDLLASQATPLDETEQAMYDFAAKVADDATKVTEADIEALRTHGLDDREIFEIILASAARCFFSKVLDATGTLADREYHDLVEPDLLAALTVGRPIAD
jgi:uncharacterized peroxidase-related enzyme